jgi:hypothetical protein
MLELSSRTGKFPQPIELGKDKALRWKTEQVAAWLREHEEIRPIQLFFRRPRGSAIQHRKP